MSSPNPFFELPTVRHPIRWALLAIGGVALLVATAQPAEAHAEHQPLPEGFEARITQVVDTAGSPASPGAEFTMAPDGALVSASYSGTDELIILGEQANEPLVRMAGGAVAVNAASPQAVQVTGADVDPAAAAELIDLVWGRVPPAWEPVAGSGAVSFMDHRAVPGHAPVRADFRDGDVAATWSIPFTVGGAEYALTGEVVAVEVAGGGTSSRDLVVATGGVLFALLIAVFALRGWRSITRRDGGAGPEDAGADERELVTSR